MSLYCANDNSIISYDSHDGMNLDSVMFDNNIIGFSVSPDQSILLILTNDFNFTVASNELEIISEFYLEQCGFGSAEPLSIGWGKKETQFHGKIGKDARNLVEKVSDQSEYDCNKPFIVWKDDGEYFAVSWISFSQLQTDAMSGTRMIRIFNKDGELFSTFEPTNTLENGLVWRTKSNLIATSCRNNKGLEIVFFEQNGLRHGGFVLYDYGNSDSKVVTSIAFNYSDDICAVVVQDLLDKSTMVNLFTTNNYHWYLKQSLRFDSLDHISIFWSMDRLHTCSKSGVHSIYEWYCEVDRSLVTNYEGSDKSFKLPSMVSVIDGDKIMMTPFEFCVIPPPYCAFTVDFNTNVSFVSMPVIESITDDYISCFVQTSDHICHWLKLSKKSNNNDDKLMKTTLQFGKSNSLFTPIIGAAKQLGGLINTIHWIDNNSFYCVMNNTLFSFSLIDSEIVEKIFETGVISVGKVCYKRQLYIQDVSGQVYQYDNDNQWTPLFSYSNFCSDMFTVQLKGEPNDVIIALSNTFKRLYINESVQSGSYLSVLPVEDHIILTNINQKLRCINIKENNFDNLINLLDDKNYKCDFDFDETFRLIEPGTEIITCIAVDSKIILMMPRGNLETIYPRALVLDDLKSLMDKCKYSHAIEKMRRQRVNLNLLYDHNPETFMDNLEKLIRDNRKTDRIVLLLSELSQEDVTDTMYKRFYECHDNRTLIGRSDKVNRVCDAVAKILENDITDEYINVILTSFVRMTPPASHKALQLLRTFKNAGNQKMWDNGLKYLQYLISIDDLYRVALSTYDLNLTLQVAQKTQLDPKEYVTFINNLNELPCEQYRRYQINTFLKKPTIALECIASIADIHWDEVVELVSRNKLYVKALQLFQQGSVHYNSISAMFAEYLVNNSNDVKAAGMVYLRTNDTQLCQLAANCFYKTLHWKEWLIAAYKCQMDSTDIDKSLINFSARLKDIGRFNEAMFITETYLHNSLQAFDIALEGRLFTDAFRIMASLTSELIESQTVKIEESIIQTYQNITNQLQDYQHKFQDNLKRLVEMRLHFIKEYKEMRFAGEDEILPDYMSDTISEVSSNSSKSSNHSKMSKMSMSSSSSSSSSRSFKKKKTKKPWSDKKGSQKEEVGIIENLYFNIKNFQNLIVDINGLIEILCYNGNVDESRVLVSMTNELLTMQFNAIVIIWDEFVLDNSNVEYELQISNHIKVSRATKFIGRRRYLLDEEFLKTAPTMNCLNIKYVVNEL